MREYLIDKLNKISTKQKEIKQELSKENFDDLHSISRSNKLTLEVKKDTLKEALLKCVSLTLK